MSELKSKVQNVIGSAKAVVFGQDKMLESILAALICEGHLLIEGVPGLGKTLSVSVMSKLCDLDFKRIQFTPDLLPSDLIGTMIYNQQKEQFNTKFGPIFTQILLADEINRSPAKVQAALLEAMAERQVTIGDTTHKLKSPFVVLATQNPIEQEGTYNLPEAQLDRFMMRVNIDYPDFASEKEVLGLKTNPLLQLNKMITAADLAELQVAVNNIHTDEKIKDIIIKIVHATRPGNSYFNKKFAPYITTGASPRAAIWLYKLSKFKAFLKGRDFVNPEDIMDIVPDVLCHRVVMSYEANLEKINTISLMREIAASQL